MDVYNLLDRSLVYLEPKFASSSTLVKWITPSGQVPHNDSRYIDEYKKHIGVFVNNYVVYRFYTQNSPKIYLDYVTKYTVQVHSFRMKYIELPERYDGNIVDFKFISVDDFDNQENGNIELYKYSRNVVYDPGYDDMYTDVRYVDTCGFNQIVDDNNRENIRNQLIHMNIITDIRKNYPNKNYYEIMFEYLNRLIGMNVKRVQISS